MKRVVCCTSLLILPFVFGCGSGIQQAIGGAAESGTRTFLDILLSDTLANLPDLFSFNGNGTTDNTGGNTGGNGGNTGGSGTGGTGGTDLTGVAADGEAIFTSVCHACHCGGTVDCSGGGIDLSGVGYDRIDEKLRGTSFHGGGKFPDYTDQDIADLEAFLAQ